MKIAIQPCVEWSQSLCIQADPSESSGMETMLYAYLRTFLYDLGWWMHLDTKSDHKGGSKMDAVVSVLPLHHTVVWDGSGNSVLS